MSARVQLGSILSCVVLLIIIGVVVITGSQANEQSAKQAAKDSAAAKAQTEHLNKTITTFIDNWEKRVQISNQVQNGTRDKIQQGVNNIIGNLTQHRIIQNISRDLDAQRQNETLEAIRHIQNVTSALTGPQYEKLADKRVENIVGNLSEDHEIIFKALNISNTDKTTDAENDTENLGQLLKDFIQDQKVKQNKPQGSKS